MIDHTTDNYGDTLADGVEKLLADRDAQIERWRHHASEWEAVARNLAQVLTFQGDVTTFRNQCEAHNLTP